MAWCPGGTPVWVSPPGSTGVALILHATAQLKLRSVATPVTVDEGAGYPHCSKRFTARRQGMTPHLTTACPLISVLAGFIESWCWVRCCPRDIGATICFAEAQHKGQLELVPSVFSAPGNAGRKPRQCTDIWWR